MKIYNNFQQTSGAWLEARCGIVTASAVCNVITDNGAYSRAKKAKDYMHQIIAERITEKPTEHFVTHDMMRGREEEELAREIYHDCHAHVAQVGFITEDRWGFTVGYSPDGLIGDDGLIEIKSRRPHYQIETMLSMEMPAEYKAQVQTGLLVTGRAWCDFVSYSANLPMFTKRIYPDFQYQKQIVDVLTDFHDELSAKMSSIMGTSDVKALIKKPSKPKEQVNA